MKKTDKNKSISSGKYILPEELKERVRGFVKGFMIEHDINASELAKRLNELDPNRSSSRTNILNKLAGGTFQLAEVMQIADLFECELRIVPKRIDRATSEDK